jgi:hypothetical protein
MDGARRSGGHVAALKREPLTVVQPLKPFGSLYVETVATLDVEAGKALHYEFVYREVETKKGTVLRLQYIRERTS